jgi:hypothetical protein
MRRGFLCICIYLYLFVFICIYLYLFVFTFKEETRREGGIEREKGGLREREGC